MPLPRPLVLIHGYSDEGKSFEDFKKMLAHTIGIPDSELESINICNYVSLNNEITIKDIAEGFERALRCLGWQDEREFDAIVHSTGMLVLRSWLTNYGAGVEDNGRLKRVKHIIGLAPATWGSPQAHKGRTWLGALVKGDKHFGPDFLNAGDRVLEGLELGSQFTWDLAHADLLGSAPYYDKGEETPFVSVFIGNRSYGGLRSIANEPGTDGTVRWAGCGLNTRKITIDLTRTPKDASRVKITPWADRLDVPMIAVADTNHATIITDPPEEMLKLIAGFLKIKDEQTYNAWLGNEEQEGALKYRKDNLGKMLEDDAPKGWQQFVVHARDERGDGISDFMIEIFRSEDNVEWVPFDEMYTEVHPYGPDQSYRCFHIRLPEDIDSDKIKLKAVIHASTGTQLMGYQGYSDGVKKELAANTEPVEIEINNLNGDDGNLFHPFTTTLIEIILNREPIPLNGISNILNWYEIAE